MREFVQFAANWPTTRVQVFSRLCCKFSKKEDNLNPKGFKTGIYLGFEARKIWSPVTDEG